MAGENQVDLAPHGRQQHGTSSGCSCLQRSSNAIDTSTATVEEPDSTGTGAAAFAMAPFRHRVHRQDRSLRALVHEDDRSQRQPRGRSQLFSFGAGIVDGETPRLTRRHGLVIDVK